MDKKDVGQILHADSAYSGAEQGKTIGKHKMKNKVHEKGYRNASLTDEQKASNKEKKSKTRATGIIGFVNLTYNLFKYEQTIR